MSQAHVKRFDESSDNNVIRLQQEIASLRDQGLERQKIETQLRATMENLTIHQEELRAQNEELRRVQDDLEESRQQYVSLFEGAPIGYFILDSHGAVQQVNFKGAEMLGYSRDYLIGKPLLPYLTHPTRLTFGSHLRTMSDNVTSASTEVDCMHSNGHIVHVRVESVLIDNRKEARRRFQTAFIDVTERKQAEESLLRTERRLRQTQKMEAIGTLAGGIAHDFNNILMGMLGYTEIVMGQLPIDSPLRPKLCEVLVAGFRARDLVKQILMFSRQTEPEKQAVPMNSLLNEVRQLLQATLPSTIQIRTKSDGQSPYVYGEPTELHQVLINLCTNAEFAMRETGGILEISIKEVEVSLEWARQHPPLKAGPTLHLTVSDTGSGMPQEVKERLFDPFFTTKSVGEGTGMGLAMVHGIIASHHGIIQVEKTGLKGTTMGIYLPLYIPSPVPDLHLPIQSPRRNGRILFVDDEAALVRMGQELLQQLGYDVSACQSSEDALALARKDPESFDVVVTDQTMPGLTGEALAKRLLTFRPDLPVILMTGFSHTMTPEKAKAMGIVTYLMKPLVIGELDRAIQSALSVDG